MTLNVLIGPPGSGKSTFLKQKGVPAELIVSRDSIRRDLTGDVSNMTREGEVTRISNEKRAKLYKKGLPIWIDGTNLNIKFRRDLLKEAEEMGYKTIAFIFSAPSEILKKRIHSDLEMGVDRSRVPDDIVDKFWKQMKSQKGMFPLEFDEVNYK